ncbi:MAG: hypothetical protein JOZ25_07610 [Actinobacteria bacterium]|nr:hypothetical protein [Actinomycetota bacterium]
MAIAVLASTGLGFGVAACGGSSGKAPHPAARGAGATATGSPQTGPAASGTITTSGSATSAPGSGNPYGPDSPTEPGGLGRILVKDGLVQAPVAKCTAAGLLKELSPPEVQALAENRAATALRARVTKAAKGCRGGAPAGG